MLYDVIVVGSGPGGAIAAAVLAAQGKSVLLADRQEFPRDKVCGDGLPLNVMVMLGLPLSTAELIQTTSRVGRLLPALVIVMHKINRERDAGVFRTFVPFIQHADRLIDHIPITRSSRAW